MPWVRKWSRIIDHASGSTKPCHERYEWLESNPTEDALDEIAREEVPSWVAEHDHTFGAEIVESLPDGVRFKLTQQYKRMREHAESMLDILNQS